MNQYFWNTAAGLLNAAEAIIFGMITNRVTGITDSGILTIAFSVGNLFASIGRWGIRTVQVTDGGEYSFRDYLNARKISISIQVLSAIFYIIISSFKNGYSFSKTYVILLMVLIYASEIVEDTFWGHFQKNNHIETGAQLFIFRWSTIIVSYGLVLLITHSIEIAMTVSTLISFIVLAYTLKKAWRPYKQINEEYKHGEKNILKKCFPIMLIYFLSFYAVNAVKFAVDFEMGNKGVAIYGFISMPVFMIGMLSSFIYNPQLLSLSIDLQKKRLRKYKKRVFRQIGVIGILTLGCTIIAWIVGIPFLELLYATNLTNYKNALVILIISGGFMAVAAFLSVTLVIEKKPRYSLIAYGTASMLSLLLYGPLIKKKGIDGAAIGFCIAMFVNAVVSTGFEMFSIHMIKRDELEKNGRG